MHLGLRLGYFLKDQLDKFNNNEDSTTVPYADCPKALTNAFRRNVDKEEQYHGILQTLQNALNPEVNAVNDTTPSNNAPNSPTI